MPNIADLSHPLECLLEFLALLGAETDIVERWPAIVGLPRQFGTSTLTTLTTLAFLPVLTLAFAVALGSGTMARNPMELQVPVAQAALVEVPLLSSKIGVGEINLDHLQSGCTSTVPFAVDARHLQGFAR